MHNLLEAKLSFQRHLGRVLTGPRLLETEWKVQWALGLAETALEKCCLHLFQTLTLKQQLRSETVLPSVPH